MADLVIPQESSSEQPIWVNGEEFLKALDRTSDVRVCHAVVGLLAYGHRSAFAWKPADIAAWLNEWSGRSDSLCANDLCEMHSDLLMFFVQLPDGRMAPSAHMFAANDPAGEMQ